MVDASPSKIPVAPRHRDGYFQARPGDVIGLTGLVLIDVRHAPEDLLGDMGHIHGITHIPAATILERGLPDIERDTPLVLVCGNGRESQPVCAKLVEDGFTEVYHLVGGMLRWNAEERPVAKTKTFK